MIKAIVDIDKLKADIMEYKKKCDLSCEDSCKDCNENMFSSIIEIIDEHTKEF